MGCSAQVIGKRSETISIKLLQEAVHFQISIKKLDLQQVTNVDLGGVIDNVLVVSAT